MRSYLRVFGVALIGAGLCLVQGAPAKAACLGFSGTADGFDKETGVSRAQLALADAINEYKKQKRLGHVTVTAMRAKPQPYWRDSVWDELFYKPDIVKSNSYTVCWHGVISPYVCTSGAKACW
jgi:hypothetical protein